MWDQLREDGIPHNSGVRPFHMDSGSRPSLSLCSGPLLLEPKIPRLLQTRLSGWEPGAKSESLDPSRLLFVSLSG